jgi:hypothetical protein
LDGRGARLWLVRYREASVMHWGLDDVRIIGDIIVGSLLASGLRLVVMKAVLEPAAVFIGRTIYRRADDALGGLLPDFLRGDPPSSD